MKLFLTSAGISTPRLSSFFLERLERDPADCRAVILAYVESADERYYFESSLYELENLGFKNIQFLNLKEDIPADPIKEADLIYVCGGNTFLILKRLRELGFDQAIPERVRGGAVYIGVSAGSIIAGPSIEIAGWGSEGDQNEIGLSELDGFALVDTAVFPHYHDELKAEVDEFAAKVPYRVIPLTDEQMLFVVPSGQAVI